MLSIVMLPAALCYTFGTMTGQRRHGWLLYGVMTLFFALGIAGVHWAENAGNPALVRAIAPLTFAAGDAAWTGNTEGKEVRFGTTGTTLAFAEQRRRVITEGSLPTESPTFAVLLVAIILVVAGLNFLPLLCVGPIVEHMMLWH
jgi:K+-transporting ATPase A subunit